MATTKAISSNAKSPYLIEITGNKVVKLQLKTSSYDSTLLTALGLTKLPDNGEIPQGKTLVGVGRQAAMMNGCFGVNLIYARTASQNQTAKVLCSPTKADTVFEQAKTATYNGKNIVEARVPRRRIYTF